jgi:hypothetical protein
VPEVRTPRPCVATAAAACTLVLAAGLAAGTSLGTPAPDAPGPAPASVGRASPPVPATPPAPVALAPVPAPARPVPRGGAATARPPGLVEAGGSGAVANSVAALTAGELLPSAGGTVPTPGTPGWLRTNPRVTWDGRPPRSGCQPIPRLGKAEVRPVGGPVGPAVPPPRPGSCPNPPE